MIYIDGKFMIFLKARDGDNVKKPQGKHMAAEMLLALWTVLQIVMTPYNIGRSIDKGYGHSYTPVSYICAAACVFIIAALNILLWLLKDKKLSGLLRDYWAISSLILIVSLIGNVFDFRLEIAMAVLFIVTPYPLLLPIVDTVDYTVMTAGMARIVITVFCVINWIYCNWVCRKSSV